MDKFGNVRKSLEASCIGSDSIKAGGNCNCKRKLDPHQLFDDNVEDISRSLAQIMLICGINTAKSYQARSIIKRAFVYHEKLRSQSPPAIKQGAHLNRDDMLQALRLKCSMERVEAMLSYAIIKRAFKAFFHGKPPITISNPISDVMAVHRQESAWMHAAYKTARIFDNYKAAFFWAHKCYEKQITLVYGALYKRMSARANPLMIPGCPCHGCRMQEVPSGPTKMEKQARSTYKLANADAMDLPEACILCGLQVPKMKDKGNNNVQMKLPRPILNHELNLPRCDKCNSPFLICECNIDQLTGEQYGECGQDSYKVKWYRLEQDTRLKSSKSPTKHLADTEMDSTSLYEEMEEPSTEWENHHCPIDCKHDSCSESSNVCSTADDDDEDGSSFISCSGAAADEDVVAKLENYLNKLWADEVAEKKQDALTHEAKSMQQPRDSCKRCQD
ncbi:uncharacterized protein [Drosophila tropicalis]|uniref:uncharacterized protein n=1 Tax=Drosophila tropicalis TaxID=46794 RepID=UPI0035AB9FFD